jgi:hypothetical protein
MGFMDKAKEAAKQAQKKLDEVQQNFNEGQAQRQQQGGGPVQYDKHGRPIQQEPAAPGAPAPGPAAPAPGPSAPAPGPSAPMAPAPGPSGGGMSGGDPLMASGDPLAAGPAAPAPQAPAPPAAP